MDRHPLSLRTDRTILALLIVLAYWLPLGLAPLFDLDEGAFGEATREMLARGDYVTTYLNGALRFDKPILIYWLQALSVRTFGLGEFALRLPSALAATFWVLLLYRFTAKHLERDTALYAALVMLGSLQINLVAKAAIADSLLNLFIAASLFCFFEYLYRHAKIFLRLSFVAIALGVLTKGPVAILIPLAVSFFYLASQRRLGLWIRSVFDPAGILLFAAIALPWYLMEYRAQGMNFIEGFIFKHNLSRFGGAMEHHSGSFWYYLPVLAVGLLPFSALAFRRLARLRRDWHDPLLRYGWIWFLFVFIFFSLSGTKLPHYVVYGITPLFILMAVEFRSRDSRLWITIPTAAFLLLLILLPDLAPLIRERIHDADARFLLDHSRPFFGWGYRLELAGVVLGLLAIHRLRSDRLYLAGLALAMILSVNYVIMPAYGALAQEPIKQAARYARQAKLGRIGLYECRTPSFSVYYRQVTPTVTRPKAGEILLTRITRLKTIRSYRTLWSGGLYTLIKVVQP